MRTFIARHVYSDGNDGDYGQQEDKTPSVARAPQQHGPKRRDREDRKVESVSPWPQDGKSRSAGITTKALMLVGT